MHNGKRVSGAESTPENVHGQDTQAGPSNPAVKDVWTPDLKEKNQVLEGIERVMDRFRQGGITHFQATSNIVDELEKWSRVSDVEREKALNSYLSEINTHPIVEIGGNLPMWITEPTSATLLSNNRSKRQRGEVDDLIKRLSQGDPEDDEDERPTAKRRAKEEGMPWYQVSNSSSCQSSCLETCKTLRQFGEDLSGVKSLLQVAYNLPEGIPSTQWDWILRGESVDLNQVLSSMHYVQLNEERKGHLGDAEVVFAITEAKQQIKSGTEWSAVFWRLIKAITFLFPHRGKELHEYADYIEGLFAAKQTNAHSKVILYDQSVCNWVGGGKNILLTDYQWFQNLSEAILHADGIEYGAAGTFQKGKSKGSGSKSGGGKKDIYKHFNSQIGCKFHKEECYYWHACQGCGKGDHGKANCIPESP